MFGIAPPSRIGTVEIPVTIPAHSVEPASELLDQVRGIVKYEVPKQCPLSGAPNGSVTPDMPVKERPNIAFASVNPKRPVYHLDAGLIFDLLLLDARVVRLAVA